METSDHLENGHLPGWPGRTIIEINGSGTYVGNFVVADRDETFQNIHGRTVTLERQSHDNFLTGKKELGWDVGDCTKHYSCFIWQVLLESQKRAVFYLREHGKYNFTHPKKTLS